MNIIILYKSFIQNSTMDEQQIIILFILLMIHRFAQIAVRNTQLLNRHNLKPTFIIMKLFKKKFKQEYEDKYEPKPQPYRHQPKTEQSQTKEVDVQQNAEEDGEYDFFTRQKEMDLNKDFRKLKLQSTIIPGDIKDLGKGGFDQVVYWSQNAATPEQIFDLIQVFNRVPYPKTISDTFTFETFITKVIQTAYLASSLQQLQQLATFGYKYKISDELYWKKIEEKTIRMNPRVSESQIKNVLQIAYIMSKLKKGETIYSTLSRVFKDKSDKLDAEDIAKLLITYYNNHEGQKQWVQELHKMILVRLSELHKDLFIELLLVFKELKTSLGHQNIMDMIVTKVPELSYKQLCIAAGYIGHDYQNQPFWQTFQKSAQQKFQTQHKSLLKSQQQLVFTLQLLSSYNLSKQYIQNNLLANLRTNNYQLIQQCSPQIRSYAAKVIYIYQLQQQSQDIQEVIQSSIMKQYNNLKNVQITALIAVIRDYSVTRNGSREFYIFLEEVVKAKFDQIMEQRDHLEALYTIYSKSNLCTAEMLSEIQYYL